MAKHGTSSLFPVGLPVMLIAQNDSWFHNWKSVLARASFAGGYHAPILIFELGLAMAVRTCSTEHVHPFLYVEPSELISFQPGNAML